MLTHRTIAKRHLDNATLTNFWEIVREAKISKEDKAILCAKFVDGDSIAKIADDTGYSTDKIQRTIQKCYDKVAKLL